MGIAKDKILWRRLHGIVPEDPPPSPLPHPPPPFHWNSDILVSYENSRSEENSTAS